MKKILNILIILLSTITTYSQINTFEQQNNSLSKKNLEFAINYKETNKQIALTYIDLGIESVANNSDNKIFAELYYTKSKIYEYYQNWDSANIFYKQAIPYYIADEDSVNAARCYINIGVTDYYFGRHVPALKSFTNADLLLRNSNETELQSKIYNNLGLLYKATGKYELSIINFHKSINLSETIDNKKSIANSYNNIGVLYWEQKNYEEALICYQKTIKIYEKLDNKKGIAAIYINIGLIYSDKKDTTKAIQYYNQAIEISKQTNYKMGLANALQNKAILISKPINYDEEEMLFLQSLELYEELGYARGIFISKMNISRIYSLKGKNKKAINYALQAIKLKNVEQPIKYLAQGYFILAKNYSDMENYKSANFYYSKYIEINDTLYNIDKNKQINDILIKYETEKKEVQLEIYEKELKISNFKIENKQKQIRNFIFLIIIITIFTVLFLILFIQKRKSYLSLVEQNVKLTKADIEKEKALKIEKSKKIKQKINCSDINLNEIQQKELLNNIIILMEEEKYFLNSQFTITDFAKKLCSNRNYLSKTINNHFKTNFTNFVNEYRIKEARKLLIDTEYDNYTIEGIATTVGFHSKSSFNSSFKKFTGVTPSFFKQNSKKH